MTKKEAICKVYWKSGKYETDAIKIISPTGHYKMLWRHSNIISYLQFKKDKKYSLYSSILDKIFKNSCYNGENLILTCEEMKAFSYMCDHQNGKIVQNWDNGEQVWINKSGE